LTVLASAGGTPGDGVLGGTLITRSPVTITLKSQDDPTVQTVYTINFVSSITISAPTLTNVTVEGISPSVSVTTNGITLTFGVSRTARYTTGTATLSENVNYRIQSGTDINVTGTATTSESLLDKALAVLAAQGGTPGDGVLGSALISRSPITITLTAQYDPSKATVYTINFEEATVISGIIPATDKGKIKFDTDVSVTAEQLAGKIKANGVNLTDFGTPTKGNPGLNWNAIIPGASYGTTYTITADVPFTISGAATVSWDAPVPAAPAVTADDKNNLITGIDATMEYQIDTGAWTTYDAANLPNLAGDHTVLVRVKAKDEYPAGATTSLTFTTNPVTPGAPSVTADDDNNVITGIDATMEYKIDAGEWTAYNAATPPNLAGSHTVLVRVKASGVNPAGATTSLTFTTNPVAYTFGVYNSLVPGMKSIVVKFTGSENENDYIVKVAGTILTYSDEEDWFIGDVLIADALEKNLLIDHK